MKKIIIISVILLFISVIFSCKKDDDITEPDNNDTTTINEVEPTGNDLINFQTVFGNENTQNSIYQMKSDDNGDFYYSGIKDGNNVIGKLNTSGSIIWEKSINFQINEFYIGDFWGGTINEYIIFVGSTFDTNRKGIVAIYDINGNLKSDEIWNNYTEVFFNDINISLKGYDAERKTLPVFLLIGGAGNTSIYPYATHFYISTNGAIVKGFPLFFPATPNKLFTNYPEMRFDKFCFDDDFAQDWGSHGNPQNSMKDENFLSFVSTYSKDNDNYSEISIAKLSDNIFIDENKIELEINWKTKIENNDLYSLGNICIENPYGVFSGNGEPYIYIVYAKKSVIINNSGDYWSNCIAAKIKETGEILWKKEYNISNYSDFYKECIFYNDYLYAIGYGVSYCNSSNSFSYGLISKISSSTGNLIENKLIGNNAYQSGLNTLLLHNDKLYLGGLTKFYECNDSPTFQAWFVEYNQNGM